MSPGYYCRAYPAFKHAFTTAPSFKRLNNKQHFPRLGSRNLSSVAGCLPCLDFQREKKLWGHPKPSALPSYPGWWGPPPYVWNKAPHGHPPLGCKCSTWEESIMNRPRYHLGSGSVLNPVLSLIWMVCHRSTGKQLLFCVNCQARPAKDLS